VNALLLFCITGMADFFWVCSRGKSEELKILKELGDCFSNKAGNLVLTSTLEIFSTVMHFCIAKALFLAGQLSSVAE